MYQNFNWYQSRHPVLSLDEILGKVLSGYGQGRRFLLKRCLNLEKFICLWEWSLEVEDGLFVTDSGMFWRLGVFDEELMCCSCARFDLFSNLWFFWCHLEYDVGTDMWHLKILRSFVDVFRCIISDVSLFWNIWDMHYIFISSAGLSYGDRMCGINQL